MVIKLIKIIIPYNNWNEFSKCLIAKDIKIPIFSDTEYTLYRLKFILPNL